MQRILFTIVIVAFAVSACQNADIQPRDELNGQFQVGQIQIKAGELIKSDNNKISLKITDINDSRCPIGSECFWAGEALVYFEFNNTAINHFVLSTLDPQTDTVDSYIFRLLEVDPYPTSFQPRGLDDYTVKLKVTKL